MKKIVSLFISLVMIFTAVLCVDITAFAQDEWVSGDVKVILNGNTITVRGKGAMADYTGLRDENLINQWRQNVNTVTKLIVESGVTEIGNFAFSSMFNLESVTISDTVTRIGERAFYSDWRITSFYIPASVTSIGEDAFRTASPSVASNLVEIVVDANNANYSSQSGILYDKAKTRLMVVPSANPINDLTVADSVKTIDAYVALKCVNLKQVTLGENVDTIGDHAFEGCSNLEKITIKNNSCTIPVLPPIPNNKNLVICANTKSTAYIFAKNNGFAFEALDAPVRPPEAEHIWDEGVVTVPATCTQSGEIVYTCLNDGCGETTTAVLPQTEHTEVTDEGVAATCTQNGKSQGSHCSVCGNVITAQETIMTTGHNWNNGKITKQATCKTTGVKTYTCTQCKATKTESIPKLKTHKLTTVTKKATTKSNGSIVTKCTVCGTVSKTTAINAIKSVSLAKTSYEYDGKAKKPTVTVKDGKGKKIDAKYYTVKYSSNKKVGKATVTVTFKGNYSGTVKKTFTIKPKATSISKLTAGKKKFTVKWKKQATQTTGYEIQYSTDKNFKKNNKTVTVSKNKTTSKSISKLKAKKKYYVRIRTYKTVNDTKIYSDWSKAKTVTTKK